MTIYTKLEDKLTKLKLTAIKEYLPSYLEGNDLSLPEILEQLTSKELAYRTQRSAKMSIHVAHFPYAKGLDEFDFDFQPSVDKQRIMNLASMNFISSAKNILFIGSSGVGKTHLATGLGMEACKNHLSTYFVNCHELIERLKLAHQENRLAAILKNYSKRGVKFCCFSSCCKSCKQYVKNIIILRSFPFLCHSSILQDCPCYSA